MNFNDIVKKETTYSFKEGAFSFDKAYRVKYKDETHICLLVAYSDNYVVFSYGGLFGEIRITPEELIKSNAGEIEIIEAVFKVDIPEVKIVSEWKTIKEAFDTPGYFNNGDCYEIRIETQIVPYYTYDNDIEMGPAFIDSYKIVEESITNGTVVDIGVKIITDDVKIRRLN